MLTNKEKAKYGLLIDYDYCTGCHTCEVACKKEKDLAVGQWGIKILQDGPRQLANGSWEYRYIPVPSFFLCDLCKDRVAEGKKPACVHNCQAQVMSCVAVEDLPAKIDKERMVFFTV
jgi:Fe-S-cluster-containing dehydrogenase component